MELLKQHNEKSRGRHLHTKCLSLALLALLCTGWADVAQARFMPGEIPALPETLTEPEDRAAYVMSHFWDKADFAEFNAAEDASELEQNFVDFIQFYPFLPAEKGDETTGKLLTAIDGTPAFESLMQLAEKYLLDSHSPFYNERAAMPYLQKEIAGGSNPRAEYLLECVGKNAVGAKASDFNFMDREGNEQSLYGFLGDDGSKQPVLLVFYNAECEDCHKVMLNSLEERVEELVGGKVKVLAVDTMCEDYTRWFLDAQMLPEDWEVGMDMSATIDNDIYVYDGVPTFYLLAPDGTVIAKNLQIP